MPPVPRPTRAPAGQVVTAADLPADSATVRITALICSETTGGFVLADDLGSGSLSERPEGCRSATAGEVTVRAEALTPDGVPVRLATATSDERGVVSITLSTGQRVTPVRLTAIAPVSDAATTVTLSSGQTRSLTLIVPDAEPAAMGMMMIAAGGLETTDPSSTNLTAWIAVSGLLLTALGVAFPVLRRRR